MLSAASLAPWFIILLGVLITIHELGHFLVAKACGVKVLTFSIGFGPRLFGFTRGETEYRLSALPLGGYVRMYGDDVNEDIPADQAHRGFLTQPFLKKSAIAFAGPAANLLFPIALFFALFVGHERVPDAVIGSVVPGDPAALAGLAPGDRVVAINGSPVAVFSDLQEIVTARAGVTLRMTVQRDHKNVDLEVTPRPAAEPTIFDHQRKVGRIGILSAVEEPVVIVDRSSPAAHAGIKDLDRVISVDGAPTRSKAELLASLDAAAGRGTARLQVQTGDDAHKPGAVREVTLTAEMPSDIVIGADRFGVTAEELAAEPLASKNAATRAALANARTAAARRFGLSPIDGRVGQVLEGTVAAEKAIAAEKDSIVAVDGRPLLTVNDLENALKSDPDGVHVVGIVAPSGARTLAFRMLPAPQRQAGGMKVFGVALTQAYGDGAMVERPVSPAEALRRAVAQTGTVIGDVVQGLGMLVTGRIGIAALSGPISIAKMSGEAAAAGVGSYVTLMALISANLAVVNLLPIPVLDGGHLMFFVVELVTRKKVKAETRQRATIVGLALVGALMLIAVTNDILGLFGP